MLRLSLLLRTTCEPVVKVCQKGKVVTLTINRPNQLNALNRDVVDTLVSHLKKYDTDPSCAVFIITGEGRAFVAGADIKMMMNKTYVDYVKGNDFAALEDMNRIGKPIIAAVNGFALGGGCELAMQCDILIASDKAKFGQPEIKLATIPGLGGTQRLTRAIGKAKAMEWVLTGGTYTAEEAERAGLVSRVVKHDDLMASAFQLAETIAAQSQVAVKLAKAAISASQETTLVAGLQYEKQLFHASFSTADQKEGMAAFAEKRTPLFKDE